MILFVGDKPSKKNINSRVAFVGTRSYKTLLEWIYYLDVDITEAMTCNRVDPWATNDVIVADKVIALGKEAERFVASIRDDYFALPHPSGLNRQLNDDLYVRRVLRECKEWLKKYPQEDQETDDPPRGA